MALCPRCEKDYHSHPTTSRRDDVTAICGACGQEETMFDLAMSQVQPGRAKEYAIERERAWLSK